MIWFPDKAAVMASPTKPLRIASMDWRW